MVTLAFPVEIAQFHRRTMVGTELFDGTPLVDIATFTLGEYIPAKPLETNLEITFPTPQKPGTEQSTAINCQLSCGEALKFPFAKTAALPISVPIKDVKVLVPAEIVEETKRVVELTLDTTDTPLEGLDYAPGDTIAVLPSNAADVVAALLQRLGLDNQADIPCHVKVADSCTKKSAKVPAHIPRHVTLRGIFTHCLQLNGVLQKQMLSSLATCTSDVKERCFLSSLSSKQATEHYNLLVLERGLRLKDVLELCASCMPTAALLVEYLPRLLPRPYSIANSPFEQPHELRIIYSLLSHRAGVTTSMLDAKVRAHPECAQQLVIYPRTPNAFRYTEQDLACNQILIAVGTGLAPFLGFLAQKQHSRQLCPHMGQTWLYIGAKTPHAILKSDALQSWLQSSTLQRLRMCHSRDARADAPKHVQQLLEQDASELIELWLQPASAVYVCADGAKISKAISNGLQLCLQRALKLDEPAAMQRLRVLRAAGKYREDVWL